MSKIAKMSYAVAIGLVTSFGAAAATRAETASQCSVGEAKQEFETVHRLHKGGTSLILSDAGRSQPVLVRLV